MVDYKVHYRKGRGVFSRVRYSEMALHFCNLTPHSSHVSTDWILSLFAGLPWGLGAIGLPWMPGRICPLAGMNDTLGAW